jgi:hypothetical protein
MMQPCVAALRCAIAEAAYHDISAMHEKMLGLATGIGMVKQSIGVSRKLAACNAEMEAEWRAAVKRRVDEAFARNSGCVVERVLIPDACSNVPKPIPHLVTRPLSDLIAVKSPLVIVVTPYMTKVQARSGWSTLSEFPSVSTIPTHVKHVVA